MIPAGFVERAALVAEQVWHTSCAVTVVEAAPLAPDWLAWSWPGDCTVRVSMKGSEMHAFPPFCTAVLHEVGHVVGWRDPVTGSVHSANPRSVMFPMRTFGRVRMNGGEWQWQGADPRCGGVR